MFNMSFNVVMLGGRLGSDPECRYMEDGSAVGNFSIATSEKWKPKDSNEYKEKTEWQPKTDTTS